MYLIHLSRNEVDWNVRRRFQEFVALHAIVKRHLAPDLMPELPPKQMRLGLKKHIEPEFVETRRGRLEGYLKQLVAHIEPERVEQLDDFLEYAEHCLYGAIRRLSELHELQQIVRMLRQAAESAAAVHVRRSSVTAAVAQQQAQTQRSASAASTLARQRSALLLRNAPLSPSVAAGSFSAGAGTGGRFGYGSIAEGAAIQAQPPAVAAARAACWAAAGWAAWGAAGSRRALAARTTTPVLW